MSSKQGSAFDDHYQDSEFVYITNTRSETIYPLKRVEAIITKLDQPKILKNKLNKVTSIKNIKHCLFSLIYCKQYPIHLKCSLILTLYLFKNIGGILLMELKSPTPFLFFIFVYFFVFMLILGQVCPAGLGLPVGARKMLG